MKSKLYGGKAPLFRRLLLLAVLAVGVGSGVHALDVDDVKALLGNRVAEEVIINMVRSDGGIYITMEEANEFRALGASENLIAALRPTATTTYQAGQPTVVTGGSAPAAVVSTPLTLAVDAVVADGSPVVAVPIVSSTPYPPRYDKEGWAVFSNHDTSPYFLTINQSNKRMFLSRFPNGGITLESGQSVAVNLRKESYKLYGDSGEDLKVKVRENETTTVALNPFGVIGNSGLTGTSVDRDNVRREVLFNNYVPPPAVVIQEAPVVVVPPPPPPVYYHRPYYYRGPRHGNSFNFGFRY